MLQRTAAALSEVRTRRLDAIRGRRNYLYENGMSKRRLRKHNSCRNLFSYKRAGNKDRKSADVRYALSESAHVVYDTLYDVVLLDFQNLSPFLHYTVPREKSQGRGRARRSLRLLPPIFTRRSRTNGCKNGENML